MWLLGQSRPTPEAKFVTMAVRGDEPTASPELVEAARNVRDWDKVGLLSAQHCVSPWVLRSISQSDVGSLIPEESLHDMRRRTRAFVLETLSLSQVLQEALLALGGKGVPVIVLKGPAIAERYYPDPALRPYRDIDLLVPMEAHREVFDVCSALGYAVAEDHGGVSAAANGTCESPLETRFAHRETGRRLEIHYDHLQIGLRPHGMADVWCRSEDRGFHGIPARVLALNDLFLFLCVHLNKHGFGGLMWFKDLDLIVRREGPRLDWEWLGQAARDEGVQTSFRYAMRLLRKLLDTPLAGPASALANGGGNVLHRVLWREAEVLNLSVGRWRRAVQFVPGDGLRGALPSVVVMGRRSDKLRALGRRLLG